MTPLQQAAKAVIAKWDEPIAPYLLGTAVYVHALRKALEAEQAQAVEPYGWMVEGVPTVMRGSLAQEIQEQEAKRIGGNCKASPLYLHPAPPPAQQVLSLDLLERLSKTLINLGYSTPEGGMEHFGARLESQLYNLCRGVDSLLAQQVAVPAGYVLVPIEPTPVILDAMSSSGWKTACYKAMLAAAQGAKP